MEKIISLRASILEEINQNELLQNELVVQILCSRRMLNEHSDTMEEVLKNLKQTDQKYPELITWLNTIGFTTACSLAFSVLNTRLRYVLAGIGGSAMPLMLFRKLTNSNKRNFLKLQIQNFIKSLNEFESAFRKIQTFFNDAAIMEQQAKILERYNKGNQVSIDLIHTIKRVIRALYCFLKYLELYYRIENKWNYLYSEVEDIDNCSLMMDTNIDYASTKTYKELFDLFAYTQSCLLLRLGLIFASDLENAKFVIEQKLPAITSNINVQIKLLPNFLDVSKYSPKLKDNIQKLIDDELSKSLSKEYVQIRSSSLDFTLKTLSLAIYSQELVNMITDGAESFEKATKKEADNLLNMMETIETQIAVCDDDQKRLMILIKKLLSKGEEPKVAIEENVVDENLEQPTLPIVSAEEPNPPQKDDFYYLDPSAEDKEKEDDAKTRTEETSVEEELSGIKHTRKNFKPVLKQLKQRIEPIDEEMKEREKKVLMEKGIVIKPEDQTAKADEEKDEDECETKSVNSGEEDEVISMVDGSDGDGDWQVATKKRKTKKNFNSYDNNRDFLASKQQVNLLGQLQPNVSALFARMEEEVLGDD